MNWQMIWRTIAWAAEGKPNFKEQANEIFIVNNSVSIQVYHYKMRKNDSCQFFVNEIGQNQTKPDLTRADETRLENTNNTLDCGRTIFLFNQSFRRINIAKEMISHNV